MNRGRRLKAIEEQLKRTDLGWLWLRRVQRFDRVADYVAWFDDAASGAARKAFLLQVATAMRRRNPLNNGCGRSGGYEDKRAVVREISSKWAKFWVANKCCGLLPNIQKALLQVLIREVCKLADILSEAAISNSDRANQWLTQESSRAAVAGSVLGQEDCNRAGLRVNDPATDASVQGPQENFWPRPPPWLDVTSSQIIMESRLWGEALEGTSIFRKLPGLMDPVGRPMLFAGELG